VIEQKTKFKNRIYTFERTIPTLISAEYVPDWNLTKAVKESIQNMLDERTETGCNIFHKAESGTAFFCDHGRGVGINQIILMGDSGKRGREDMIGQHGEGEIVSFMVAAREGVQKTMVSRDWLVRGRLDDLAGRQALYLDVYRAPKVTRSGTAWEYSGGDSVISFCNAFEQFRVKIRQQARQEREARRWEKQAAKNRKQQRQRQKQQRARKGLLDREYAGQLFTNGLFVNNIDGLAFAYNLKATPGRDRAAFTWEFVKDEIVSIFNAEAELKHVVKLLRAATRNGAENVLEFKLDLNLDVKLVQKAIRKVSNSRSLRKLAWADFGKHASYIADAADQQITVIGFHGDPPAWVKNAIHCVTKVVGMTSKVKEGPLPGWLQKATDAACFLLIEDITNTPEFYSILRDPSSDRTQAYASLGKVVLVRTAVKEMNTITFLETLAHELGHAIGGYPDNTRGHASYIGQILARALTLAATSEEHRKAYQEMVKWLDKYCGR
jgi:hypothetical protein